MKTKIFTLLLCTLFVAIVSAQERPAYSVPRVDIGPVIDGKIDELWERLPANLIDKNFQAELPTIGELGKTYWKMVWAENSGIYLLVVVTDDYWYPPYVDGSSFPWLYDRPEVFFDCNHFLQDDAGASGEGQPGNGHHQCAPPPTDGLNDGTMLDAGEDGEADPDDLGVKYAYMLNDPDYLVEYFFPMEYLTDKDGFIADLSGEVGFDITICDRDEGDDDDPRKRAVWANTGVGGDANESWNSMDDCGILTFEGVNEKVYVESIALTASDITMNNKPMKITAVVLPDEATNKKLSWSVEGVTGRASVDNNGVVTPIADGLVKITATAQDGSWEKATVDVNISGQMVSMHELNLFRNGYFNNVNEDGIALEWSPGFEVIGGALYIPAADGVFVSPWDGDRNSRQTGFGCNSTDTYLFSFVMWSEAADSFYINFEDPANDYFRYGSTSSEWSPGGTSEWWIITEQEPTKYVIDDLVFNGIVENTSENFNLMGGGHNNGGVYIDSLILVNTNDISMLAAPYKEVESVTVTGEGGATTIVSGRTLQMLAEVLPADAEYSDVVYWSIVPGTGDATIDDNGVLTADSIGTVKVMATASDDSQVYGMLNIIIEECNLSSNIQFDAHVTDESCPGALDGSINISVSGTYPPFTYLWSTGSDTSEISNLPSGIYEVVVTDSKACKISELFTVSSPIPIVISEEISEPTCNGAADGIINLDVSGGTEPYQISWFDESAADTISDLEAGCYDVKVTDDIGCIKEKNICLSEPNPLILSLSKRDNLCFGDSTGMIYANAGGGTPGYEYIWSDQQAQESNGMLTAGNYTITVLDARDCSTVESMEITDPPKTMISEIIGTPHAKEFQTYTYSVTNQTGYLFHWEVDRGNVLSGQGTHVVDIQWGSGPSGYIKTVAESELGCYSDTTSLSVSIITADIASVEVKKFCIYPNPTTNVLTIETSDMGEYTFQLTMLNGQLLIKEEITDPVYNLDLSSFQKGIYFITVRSQDFVTTRKIIKL
ncbi:MAG: T9SS type A sorting domain-containing protein [Bacteroidota bacterium]